MVKEIDFEYCMHKNLFARMYYKKKNRKTRPKIMVKLNAHKIYTKHHTKKSYIPMKTIATKKCEKKLFPPNELLMHKKFSYSTITMKFVLGNEDPG
jgi:hypothetical protein